MEPVFFLYCSCIPPVFSHRWPFTIGSSKVFLCSCRRPSRSTLREAYPKGAQEGGGDYRLLCAMPNGGAEYIEKVFPVKNRRAWEVLKIQNMIRHHKRFALSGGAESNPKCRRRSGREATPHPVIQATSRRLAILQGCVTKVRCPCSGFLRFPQNCVIITSRFILRLCPG